MTGKRKNEWGIPKIGVVYREQGLHGARHFKLISRVNPRGKEIHPYWVVETVGTGRPSLIREDRLYRRYTYVGPAEEEAGE